MLNNNNSIIMFFLRPEMQALKYRINTADSFGIDVPVYAELSGKDFFFSETCHSTSTFSLFTWSSAIRVFHPKHQVPHSKKPVSKRTTELLTQFTKEDLPHCFNQKLDQELKINVFHVPCSKVLEWWSHISDLIKYTWYFLKTSHQLYCGISSCSLFS